MGKTCISTLAFATLMAVGVQARAEQDFAYVVQTGDTPWNVTQRFLSSLGMWRQLVAHNHITDDRHLLPGTVLHIPFAWLKLTSATLRIQALAGTVQVDQGHGWQAATPGLVLAQSQRLRTQEQSSATLDLGDGATTMVRENSELTITATGRVQGNGAMLLRIELVRGGLESMVHNLKKSGGRFDIETPAAVTSVRGTTFRVSTAEGTATTEVLDGTVDLSNASGSVSLQRGTGSRVEKNHAPEAPRELLPPPDLGTFSEDIVNPPRAIAVAPMTGATAYRLQILSTSGEGNAQHPATVHEKTDTRLTLPDLPDGRYTVRVRGIDAIGLEGLSAQRQVTVRHAVAAAVTVPPPVVPQWLAVETGKQLVLRWRGVDARDLIQVQVRRMGGAIVLDEFVRASQMTLSMPEPGRYGVRIRYATEVDKDTPWSDERPFDGRDAPARWPAFLTGPRPGQ